jgi:hypothetical protein
MPVLMQLFLLGALPGVSFMKNEFGIYSAKRGSIFLVFQSVILASGIEDRQLF